MNKDREYRQEAEEARAEIEGPYEELTPPGSINRAVLDQFDLPYTTVTPLSVGSVVEYTGSQKHGRYIIIRHEDPRAMFRPEEGVLPQQIAEAYPDGVAYEIWPEGAEVRFGNRHLAVYRVRRKSLKLITSS